MTTVYFSPTGIQLHPVNTFLTLTAMQHGIQENYVIFSAEK